MNGQHTDAHTKALEFCNYTSIYAVVVTIALVSWVASGVEFSSEGLRLSSMACLSLSVLFGLCALALIPLVQEARRPGQSNFDVQARFHLFGARSCGLKTLLLPQYAFLLAGLFLYMIGMIN